MKTIHFDSLSDCVDNARLPFKRIENTEQFNLSVLNQRHSRDWHGIDGGFPAVSNMVEITGYPEGGRLIAEMLDSLQPSLPRALGIRRKKRRAELGDEYDIHAAMRGDHDRAWTQSHKELRHGAGIARIIVDVCASHSTLAKTLRWRGVAGIALCSALQEAGYSIEIVAAIATEKSFSRETLLWTCTVKPRHGSTDIDYLAATLVLPGFFRTFGFAGIIRAADNARRNIVHGLGKAIPVSNIYPPEGDCIEIIVPNTVMNEEAARDWVSEAITLLQGDSA